MELNKVNSLNNASFLSSSSSSNSSLYLPSQKKSGNVTSSTLKTLRQHIHFVVTKKYGFTLQLEAVKYLEQVFSDYQLSRDEWESTLEFIVQAYRNHEAGHRLPIISKDDIHLIITRLEHHASSFSFSSTHSFLPSGKDTPPVYSTSFTSEDVQLTNLIHVIQAWDQPKWQFNIDTKTFQKIEKPNPLHGTAQSKALMYRERYDLIKQRILRNQNFRPASSTYYSNQNDRFFIITPISSIRGRANDSFVLFGMLCKYEDEKLYLEDPTGHVEIDISKAARSRGLFTETCFVVLDGIYTEDKKFIVKAMAMPPAEPRIGTIEVFGQLDFLGISQHEIYDQNQLKHFEEKYDGVNMVFLSNVYLDVPQVMNALRKLLTGCEDALCPLVMVFCGDFTSTTVPLSKYEQLWIRFVDLLASFPTIAQSTTLVFVPGPHDPLCVHSMLPKMNLPPWVTKLVTKKLQKGVVTTNPCRLAYCGQEIVVFRRNLVHQMHRNALVVGDIKAEMGLPYHLARTLIDQSHVCPLPLHISPVLWDYAHTLHLYPLPTLLVIADTVDKFHEEYEHVNVVNPGSFATSHGFGFLVYYPKGQRVEMSSLGDD